MIGRLKLQYFLGLAVIAVLAALIYFFSVFVEDRITESVEIEAQDRSALFAGAIRGDLQRHLIVPRILSQDTKIAMGLLKYDPQIDADFTRLVEELDRATLYLVARNGWIVNASNPDVKNTRFLYPDIWNAVLQNGDVNFFDTERQVFVTISRVEEEQIVTPLGIVVMEVALAPYPRLWERLDTNMMMLRQDGAILASRYPEEVGMNIENVINFPQSMDITSIKFKQSYRYRGEDSYLYISDLGINGWRLIYAVPSQEARQQINGIVVLAVFLLAFILLLVLYALSRRVARQSSRFRRESEELRALNARLITEIEQRRKAEENLQSAEQSLEQSAKLAVIGQLSAAVGHELNQPLAAMRTYLASVRMLMRRSRFFEAAQNLNRIDDLVERMNSITRQMRSFARAHENQITEFDLNTSIMNAFQLMAPQLGQMEVEIDRNLPLHPVYVKGDQMRAEQILINILRNALEAVENEEKPKIQIDLKETDTNAKLIVTDNGPGIAQPDQLFEPFYTTKSAGEGLGLGLAISASYAKDMGGNLLARNSALKGAVFELILPKAKKASEIEE